jgi:hypothetical protein
VHSKLGATAKARLLLEEVVVILRRTRPAHPNTFVAINNLGTSALTSRDCMVALALREEAAASALRELGPEHPCSQVLTGELAQTRRFVAVEPSGTRAGGTLVGLASKPELNGEEAYVVGFDTAKGRYRVRHEGNAHGIRARARE